MTNQEIGANIKKIIDERGLKQKYVADKAGFTEDDLSRMINGYKPIRAEYLPTIAKVLGVTINDLSGMA